MGTTTRVGLEAGGTVQNASQLLVHFDDLGCCQLQVSAVSLPLSRLLRLPGCAHYAAVDTYPGSRRVQLLGPVVAAPCRFPQISKTSCRG